MAEWRAVGRVEDVPEGRGKRVVIDGLGVAIFNDGGAFHALIDRCPHADGSMGQGWIEEGEAVCPLHMWRFRLATGRCTTIRGHSLHRFRCEVRGEEVWVAL